MACIREVNRLALVAFSPYMAAGTPYMAAGTMAGTADISFCSSANLEIFQLDFESDDRNLPLVGAIPSSAPFSRLSWGTDVSYEFSPGLIAGGLVDGNIGLWNPRLLISSEEGESAPVKQLSGHKGPVCGLEFCSFSPNLLASGADKGEIFIWDIGNPSNPYRFPLPKGIGWAKQEEISFLSWNKMVKPLLASTSFNGTTAVLDMRTLETITSFSDSIRRRCSVLQWHPHISSQLIVASDNDSSPALRIWDLRNTMSPLKELVGHSKGVVAMSWCPSDSSFLLSCAKDNRTICWDTVSDEIVSELPAGTNWNFDVHWYPRMPGVISASSCDGKIGIYNIEACDPWYGAGDNDFGGVLSMVRQRMVESDHDPDIPLAKRLKIGSGCHCNQEEGNAVGTSMKIASGCHCNEGKWEAEKEPTNEEKYGELHRKLVECSRRVLELYYAIYKTNYIYIERKMRNTTENLKDTLARMANPQLLKSNRNLGLMIKGTQILTRAQSSHHPDHLFDA